MHLTREEERILAGEEGEARRLALSVIVKVGEALGAERLIPIKHAHVSGASYSTVGEAGRRFIEDLARMGARFSVPTTVNPVGYDTEDPGSIPYTRLTREYIRGQKSILDSFKSMGADLILTCTPYYTIIPKNLGLAPGTHVAWGESSAVVYGNSFLGIRTNREGGPLALMAAIVGRTYYHGLHTPEGRKPVVEIIVESGPLDEAEAGILGEAIVEYTPHGRVPLVRARIATEPGLRELAAAVGTAGDLGMIHLDGVTPEEADTSYIQERITLSRRELEERMERAAPDERPDIVYIGCPHAGINDLELLARELRRLGRPRSRVVVSTSRHVYMEAMGRGLIAKLKEYGVEFVRDSCLIVSPFRSSNVHVATNSYKAYFYLNKKGVKTSLAPIPRLLESAR